ncbi:hypothetical protein KUTeg_013730 [Tegillarca granosa]|uniref:Uncharacterized protein n=1 Tax=Tegillarca granosa TaxID=220873 RepID=A0ABQ9EUJ1_TEGGR|nr:hypothetical protein KUTeg_013730 [Tegillarca granosa]
MSELDPNKLKVAELKEELKARGLEVKGTKAVLVKRLSEALAGGSGDANEEDNLDDSKLEEMDDSSQEAVDTSADMTSDPVAADDSTVGNEETPAGNEDEEMKKAEKMLEENGQEEAEEDPENAEYQTIDETTADDEEKDHKKSRKRSRSRSHERKRSRSRSHERKRSRSRSRERREREREREREERERAKVVMEDDSWEQSTDVMLDRFNSDLNLKIDGNKGTPMYHDGFAMMWAGARATYGVKRGSVAFEVKLLEDLNVDHLPAEEVTRHVARVGWSADSTSMHLGEEKLSFGFGGTGKASTECKFEEYGQTFGAGDVITAYIEVDDDSALFSYAKNGEELGICFQIDTSELNDEALFPHVYTKNISFECNFGHNEEPFFPLKEDFNFIANVPVEERVRGLAPPAKKEECEMIMMVGLPACGKTTWAEKHAAENPDKHYNILGTNSIIDKMRVMGLPRKRNYAGRWDVLIDKSTRCLNKLLECAARKKRNYILDQTNVYASARRRKMMPFEGFQRKAVVIVPTDEDYKSRCEAQAKEEGKDVPEKAVIEMKGNKGKNDRYGGGGRRDDRRNRGNRDRRRDSRYNDRRSGGGGGGGYSRDRYGGGGGGGRYGDRDRRDRYRQDSSGGWRNQSGGGRQGGNWGGSGGGSRSYGTSNQGSWGNPGSWGNQGWGNQGWGNQQQSGYGWGNYNQGSSNQGWNQAATNWGQGYGQQQWGQGYNQWGGGYNTSSYK